MNQRNICNRMSIGITVLGIVLCVPAALLAQDSAPPQDSQGTAAQQSGPDDQSMHMHQHQPPSPEHQLKRLTRTLNLTSDQQQKMLPILQDQQKQRDAIQNNSALSPDQRREQMRAAMMDSHQKLEAIMTDSQKQQFEQNMQQRRSGRMGQSEGAGGGGTPPPPPPDNQNSPPPPPQQ
jgi:protein CpxP